MKISTGQVGQRSRLLLKEMGERKDVKLSFLSQRAGKQTHSAVEGCMQPHGLLQFFRNSKVD